MVRCRASVLTLVLLTMFATFGFAQIPAPPRSGSGIFRGRQVHYQIVNGKMMFEGDIALERVDHKLPLGGFKPGGTLDYLQYIWPKVGSVHQIPYIIDPANVDVANINAAIAQYNSIFGSIVKWVPQTTESDYIDFQLDINDTSGVGNSYIGKAGGQQLIWGAGNCTVPTLLHEMGHATGLWHEQSRPDRNAYVTVLYSNMISVLQYASDPQFDDIQSLTLYDWGSLMHYGAWSFTRNGAPTLESIPAGLVLSNNVGYSAGDIDAIKRLYGSVPSVVTVTTNPPGLQVIVDGTTVTTPKTFNWALRSTHTVNVATNAQTLGGINYIYGRWNDNGVVSHTITVLPGNGELAFPAAKPAVTVYTANFIQLVPYGMTISPANAGTVAANPLPQSYPGVGGLYFPVRQLVTLTATPNAGQNFYEYINSPFWLPGGLSSNPKTFYVSDDGSSINTTAYFSPSSSPVYTVSSNPADSRFYVNVDGSYWPSPKSFSSFYDFGWTSGSSHSISVDPTQWPWTLNSRYLFGSWSDGGGQTHNIVVPSVSTTYTATLSPQYYLSDYANQGCAGTVGVTPSSPTGDSFYPSGTLLSFSETPATGWTFTGWQHDLTGSGNPQNATMNDELLVTADYSTTAAPVTVTSLSPAAAVSGGPNFTLTINGTGFAPDSLVFVNNLFRTATFVNSNKLTVAMTSADLATAGGQQVFVENFPSGAACAAFAALPFNVASAPIVKPTPQSIAFGALPVSTTSAVKMVTIKNTSATAVTVNSITPSGDFAISSNSCGSSLAAGGSCQVGLTFTPASSGAVTGSLAVNDTAPDSPQIVALTGTGNLPLSISPANLAFGTVAVGSTSAAKTVMLTNNQPTTLSFSFAASGGYGISSGGTTCGASLASKAKCNVAVTFSPTANGSTNGVLSVSDATAFTPQIVGLTGTGSGGGASPLTFNPATVNFNSTQVSGTSSPAKLVTIKNASATPITLSSIIASAEFSEAGTGTNPCTASLQLNANATCTINVTFSPALGASGSIKGSLLVVDNAAVSQQILNMQGSASLPLAFSTNSLPFSTQTVGTTSAPQTVFVTNELAASTSLSITGNGEFAAVPGGVTPCGSSMAAHTQCTFNVTFTPSGVGNRGSSVTVTSSGNPSVQLIAVTGTGQ